MLVLVGQALQPGGHLLLGLHQDVQQVLGDVAVLIVEEGRGQAWAGRQRHAHVIQSFRAVALNLFTPSTTSENTCLPKYHHNVKL